MSQSLLGCLSESTSLILRRTTLFLHTLVYYCCAFYICLLTPMFLKSSWLFTKLYIFPGCHCSCCIAENVAMPMVVPMFSDSQCMNVKELPWIYFRYMKQYFSFFLISERFCISTLKPLLLVRLLSPPGLLTHCQAAFHVDTLESLSNFQWFFIKWLLFVIVTFVPSVLWDWNDFARLPQCISGLNQFGKPTKDYRGLD